MSDNNKSANKSGSSSKKLRTIIIAVCLTLAVAGVIVAVVISNKRSEETPFEQLGHTETDAAGAIVTDPAGDPVYFDDNGNVVTDPANTTTFPVFDPDNPEDDGISFEETSQLVTAGTDQGKWPEAELPSEIPAFADYLEIYNAKYTVQDDEETWFIFWNCKNTEFSEWMQKLIANGFVADDRVINLYSDGNYVLNIESQVHGEGEVDVSIDVEKAAVLDYPEVVSKMFPAFSADATLYFTYSDEDEINYMYKMCYVCAKNWDADLAAYKNALAEAGFEVGEDGATKEVAGKTYTVYWAGGEAVSAYKTLVYTY